MLWVGLSQALHAHFADPTRIGLENMDAETVQLYDLSDLRNTTELGD